MHSSNSNLILGRFIDDMFLGLFQKGDDLLSFYGGETFEEVIDIFSSFQVVNQRLHRDSCPCENGSAPKDIGRWLNNFSIHGLIIQKYA